MIRLTLNTRVISGRFQQLGCILAIGLVIWWGACLPWWNLWAGYELLLVVGISFIITALVISVGTINDKLGAKQ